MHARPLLATHVLLPSKGDSRTGTVLPAILESSKICLLLTWTNYTVPGLMRQTQGRSLVLQSERCVAGAKHTVPFLYKYTAACPCQTGQHGTLLLGKKDWRPSSIFSVYRPEDLPRNNRPSGCQPGDLGSWSKLHELALQDGDRKDGRARSAWNRRAEVTAKGQEESRTFSC